MKKYIIALCSICMLFSLCACGSADKPSDTQQPETPPDLTGEWVQTNSNSEDSYQIATITADAIEIYWVSDGGDTKALYWAGTFAAPQSVGDYTWTSENDTEKTSMALLAATAETKDFTYSDGVISYEVEALGVSTVVKLEKQ